MTQPNSPAFQATSGSATPGYNLNGDQHDSPSHPSMDGQKIPSGSSLINEKKVHSDKSSTEITTPPSSGGSKDESPVQEPAVDTENYPTGMKLALIMISLFLTMFLVALDRTIIATAIPQITNDFDSLGDVGWYGSAYLLTSCAFQLFFGKVYSFYSTKWVLLMAIGFFEAGSAICGAAPNSYTFIIGRAIAGFGCAGIFSGAIVVMVGSLPLHKRPAYQGGFGAVFGIASVVGPLLGGALTTKATWRWCFYINLPIGAVSVFVIALILKLDAPQRSGKTFKEQFGQLDPIGTAFFLPGVVCLLLALQWGGSTYAWGNSRIIVLLVLAGISLIGFIGVQIWKQDKGTVPPRILKQRSIASGFTFALLSGSSMMIFVYFLPIWFQAILGASAYDSGIKLLPLVIALVVGAGASGGITSAFGYYTPALIIGTCIMCMGAGLITSFSISTSTGKWIGYQILYGFGLGFSMQVPSMAAQTALSKEDVPVGASLMFFAQWLGGALFISVGQNVLSNKLVEGFNNAGLDGNLVTQFGATDLRTAVPVEFLHQVLVIYNDALSKVFVVALALVCTAIIPALTMEWKSVRKDLPAKISKTEDAEVEKAPADAETKV